MFFSKLGYHRKYNAFNELSNEGNLNYNNINSFNANKSKRIDTENEIDSKNTLLTKNKDMNLPHKYEIDLPHIQKIYDEENNNYIRNYYLKKNSINNVSLDDSLNRKYHIDAIIDDHNNNIYDKIEPDQIINFNSIDEIVKNKEEINKGQIN